jgi:Spy/CpxP family protein refolding chaperone
MRTFGLFLILIHLSAVTYAAESNAKKKKTTGPTTASKTKTTTLPNEVGIELTKKAKECDQALQTINGTINGGPGCSSKAQVKEQGKEQQAKVLEEMGMNGPPVLSYEAQSNKREIKGRTTQYKDLSGRELTLSVLTPEQADEVMTKLKSDTSDLKYQISETGCFPRAHFLGQRLQNLGVEAGKAWFEPSFAVGKIKPVMNGKSERGAQEWQFHVAPFILVDNNGKIEERVVDFALSDKATPLDQYKAQLSPRPYWLNVQMSNRFAYDRRERWAQKSYYNGADSARASEELRCIEKDLRDGTRSCRVIDSH